MNLTALLLLASDQPGPIDNGNDFWFIPAATEYADTHDWVYSIVLWLSIFFFILDRGSRGWTEQQNPTFPICLRIGLGQISQFRSWIFQAFQAPFWIS